MPCVCRPTTTVPWRVAVSVGVRVGLDLTPLGHRNRFRLDDSWNLILHL